MSEFDKGIKGDVVMKDTENSGIGEEYTDTEKPENIDFEKIYGGTGGKAVKCVNWECKECDRKSTDPFYVGGMHREECRYRGIIGCKVCKHYVKGVKCEFASTANT